MCHNHKKTKHGMDLKTCEKIEVKFAKQTDSKTHLYHICKEFSTHKIYNLKRKNEKNDAIFWRQEY